MGSRSAEQRGRAAKSLPWRKEANLRAEYTRGFHPPEALRWQDTRRASGGPEFVTRAPPCCGLQSGGADGWTDQRPQLVGGRVSWGPAQARGAETVAGPPRLWERWEDKGTSRALQEPPPHRAGQVTVELRRPRRCRRYAWRRLRGLGSPIVVARAASMSAPSAGQPRGQLRHRDKSACLPIPCPLPGKRLCTQPTREHPV